MSNLCIKVCAEFHAQGFKKDIDPRTQKESYNIVKLSGGQWMKSTKPSLHEAVVLTELNFSAMPALRELSEKIDSLDEEICSEGGRIFISEYLVYKIKKGTQTPLLVFENTDKVDGIFRRLCDEMIAVGLERDRYRTEETYMLTKTAGKEWSMTTGHENHSGTKIILDLEKMPLFKAIAAKINKVDPKFHMNGGRVFITPTKIYRLNNRTEVLLPII